MLIFDANLRVIHGNRSAEHSLTPGPDVPARLELRAGSPDAEKLLQALASLFQHTVQVDLPHLTLPTKGGQPRLYHLVARRLPCAGLPNAAPNAPACPPTAVMMLHEIAEITALEQRLAVSERMAAVGQLAAKVAHELNNPLDGIMRYINLSQRKIREHTYDDLERYLEDVKFGLNRMAEIVRELLEFGRHQSSVMQDSELNYVIEQSVKTMKPLADRQQIPIIVNLSPLIMARVSMNLYQVLCNLLKNAIDAMPNGGRLTIQTLKEDDTAVIQVQDTGPGIKPEDMPYIFEPFFSTKPTGQGTGLGLAVCKEIVEKMGGAIGARNRDAAEPGCEFFLRLPRISIRAQEVKTSHAWSDYQI